jgi:hypothetical protein
MSRRDRLAVAEQAARRIGVVLLDGAGLHCDVDDSSTTCSRSGSVGMTITMSRADGRIGSLSISASNYAVPDDPAVVNLVSGYLFDTGLGGPAASRWVLAHADSAIPVRTDLGGLHLRLDGGGDRALYVSVGEITN